MDIGGALGLKRSRTVGKLYACDDIAPRRGWRYRMLLRAVKRGNDVHC